MKPHEGKPCAVYTALNSGKMTGRGSWSQAQRYIALISVFRRQRHIPSKTLSQSKKKKAQGAAAGHRAPYPPHSLSGLPLQTSMSAYNCPHPVSTSVRTSGAAIDACAHQARPFYGMAGPVPPWNGTVKTLPLSATGAHLCPG